MEHSDFSIGLEFTCGDRTWRCTDVGTRTVVAIRIDEVEVGGETPRTLDRKAAEAEGWFNGPSYAVAERVFDEDDFPACEGLGQAVASPG